MCRGSLKTPSSSSRSRKAGIVETAAVIAISASSRREALAIGPEEREDAARVGAADRGVLGALARRGRRRDRHAAPAAARLGACRARAHAAVGSAGSRSSDVPATGVPSRATSQMLSRSSSSSGRASGSPSTTSRSASLPTSIVPTCSASPSARRAAGGRGEQALERRQPHVDHAHELERAGGGAGPSRSPSRSSRPRHELPGS